MSLIPVDESDEGERSPGQHGDSTADLSFAGRLARAARRAVGAAIGRVRALAGRDEGSPRPDGAGRFLPRRDTTTRKPVARPSPEDAAESDCPPVGGLPAREQPLTVPAPEYSDNPAELVAEREGDAVTLSLPDEPDATITSDVWEPVEP